MNKKILLTLVLSATVVSACQTTTLQVPATRYQIQTTNTHAEPGLALETYSNLADCNEGIKNYARGIAARINNPSISSNPVKIAVASQDTMPSAEALAMFRCQRLQ